LLGRLRSPTGVTGGNVRFRRRRTFARRRNPYAPPAFFATAWSIRPSVFWMTSGVTLLAGLTWQRAQLGNDVLRIRIGTTPGVPDDCRTCDEVGAATVFVVGDMAKSVEHYRDVLGFTVTFQYGKPTFYACLCRDEVALHLVASHRTKRLPGNGGICVFVRDVDGVYAELAARGANVIKPPQNYDYGMRDFDVVDLDGNQLTFGMGTSSPT